MPATPVRVASPGSEKGISWFSRSRKYLPFLDVFSRTGKFVGKIGEGPLFFPNGKMKVTSIQDALQLGQLIRRRRRELGLTQTEVAEVANTNLRFVSELERGKPTARLENVMRVLATLGIELEARIR